MDFALTADSAEEVVPNSKGLLCSEVKNIYRVFLQPSSLKLCWNKSSILLMKWKRESSSTAVWFSRSTLSSKAGTMKLTLRFAGDLYSMLCSKSEDIIQVNERA